MCAHCKVFLLTKPLTQLHRSSNCVRVRLSVDGVSSSALTHAYPRTCKRKYILTVYPTKNTEISLDSKLLSERGCAPFDAAGETKDRDRIDRSKERDRRDRSRDRERRGGDRDRRDRTLVFTSIDSQ